MTTVNYKGFEIKTEVNGNKDRSIATKNNTYVYGTFSDVNKQNSLDKMHVKIDRNS